MSILSYITALIDKGWSKIKGPSNPPDSDQSSHEPEVSKPYNVRQTLHINRQDFPRNAPAIQPRQENGCAAEQGRRSSITPWEFQNADGSFGAQGKEKKKIFGVFRVRGKGKKVTR